MQMSECNTERIIRIGNEHTAVLEDESSSSFTAMLNLLSLFRVVV